MLRTAPRLLPLLLASLAFDALAARPMATDDARLTTAGSCQLESWGKFAPGLREYWVAPACNPFGNLELTLAANRIRQDEQATSHDTQFQFKTLFRELDGDGWGWGMALGAMRHPTGAPDDRGYHYAYLPLSVALAEQRVVLHLNLGWQRDQHGRQLTTTWGAGSEIKLHERLLAIAEVYGDDRQSAAWQVGARFAIVPERFQIDATLGRHVDQPWANHWLSLGLRLTPDRFF